MQQQWRIQGFLQQQSHKSTKIAVWEPEIGTRHLFQGIQEHMNRQEVQQKGHKLVLKNTNNQLTIFNVYAFTKKNLTI